MNEAKRLNTYKLTENCTILIYSQTVIEKVHMFACKYLILTVIVNI